jgi:hypothetical protein
MKPFHFPLQRVLDWREQQFQMLQLRREAAEAEVAATDARLVQVGLAVRHAEQFVTAESTIDAAVLAGFSAFRGRMKTMDAQLRSERSAAEARRLAVIQECVIARRRCRLLEKLRDRRREEHEQAINRELEEIASELTLARWQPNR